MRPDWTKPRRKPTSLIDLSTNICYDQYVEREINSFLHSSETCFGATDYADELPVYNAISKYHNGIPLTNITLGFGLGELYGRIVRLFQHHSFAIHSPTWEFASVACSINNVLYSEINNIKQPTGASVLYVANPNGITGNVISKYTLEGLANKYNLVIVDEAYSEYSLTNDSLAEHATTSSNIIVLKTLTKSLGLAGVRIGYALANKEITNMLQTTRPSSVTTTAASVLAPLLFDMIPRHVERMKETKEWLVQKYDLIPTNGNFVLFDTLPTQIQQHFKVKKTPAGYRMALTNKEVITNAID